MSVGLVCRRLNTPLGFTESSMRDGYLPLVLHDATCFHEWFFSETPFEKVVSHNLAQYELI